MLNQRREFEEDLTRSLSSSTPLDGKIDAASLVSECLSKHQLVRALMIYSLSTQCSFLASIFIMNIPILILNTAIILYNYKYVEAKRIITEKANKNYSFALTRLLIDGKLDEAKKLIKESMRFSFKSVAMPAAQTLLSVLARALPYRVLYSTVNQVPPQLFSMPFLWISDLTQPDPTYILPLLFGFYPLLKYFEATRRLHRGLAPISIVAGFSAVLVYLLSGMSANYLCYSLFSCYGSELISVFLHSAVGRRIFRIKLPEVTHQDMNFVWDSMNLKYIKAYLDRFSLDHSTLSVKEKTELENSSKAYRKILHKKAKGKAAK